MLIRTAANLYWMMRYLTRAEATVRLIDTLRMSPHPASNKTWHDVLVICRAQDNSPYVSKAGAMDFLKFMILNDSNSLSVISAIKAARCKARIEFNILSRDVWENLNKMWLEMMQTNALKQVDLDYSALLESLKSHLAMVVNLSISTFPHNLLYRFLLVGTFLERMEFTARTLYTRWPSQLNMGKEDSDSHYYRLVEILKGVGEFHSYRQIYSGPITKERVAELLIIRADIPHSLRFCLDQIRGSSEALDSRAFYGSKTKELVADLYSRFCADSNGKILPTPVPKFLSDIINRIRCISDHIEAQFSIQNGAASKPISNSENEKANVTAHFLPDKSSGELSKIL